MIYHYPPPSLLFDSPNTSRRFALGARNVYLVGGTRHAPSRQCRDARVHGHTTTAMHEYRVPAPRPPAPPLRGIDPPRKSRPRLSPGVQVVQGGGG